MFSKVAKRCSGCVLMFAIEVGWIVEADRVMHLHSLVKSETHAGVFLVVTEVAMCLSESYVVYTYAGGNR